MATDKEVMESSKSCLAYQLTIGVAKIRLLTILTKGAVNSIDIPAEVAKSLITDVVELNGLVALLVNLTDRAGILTLEQIDQYIKAPSDEAAASSRKILYEVVKHMDNVAKEFNPEPSNA
jgi:hypothetical protein